MSYQANKLISTAVWHAILSTPNKPDRPTSYPHMQRMSASKAKMREKKLRNQPISVQYPGTSTQNGDSGSKNSLPFLNVYSACFSNVSCSIRCLSIMQIITFNLDYIINRQIVTFTYVTLSHFLAFNQHNLNDRGDLVDLDGGYMSHMSQKTECLFYPKAKVLMLALHHQENRRSNTSGATGFEDTKKTVGSMPERCLTA